MTDTGKHPGTVKRRKLTDAEKEKIKQAIRERYGDRKLVTPALFFRLGSMVLIILFSIGIIYNLKRRAQQNESARAKVVITVDTDAPATETPGTSTHAEDE